MDFDKHVEKKRETGTFKTSWTETIYFDQGH